MENLRQMKIDEIADGEFEMIPTTDDPPPIEVESSEEGIPYCEFLTGGAGTGKTTEIKRRMEEYAEANGGAAYGVVAATTGIAAINLGDGVTTINSLLGFFDLNNLQENRLNGKLQRALREVANRARYLIIDEISMMHAEMLDILWEGIVDLNKLTDIKGKGGLGIILTGDFCQLPPVGEREEWGKGPSKEVRYAFEALCWKYFDKRITKLDKVWRQTDPQFLKALDYARRGDGDNCAIVLSKHPGVKFVQEVAINFEGTTIYSRNNEVDKHNQARLRQLLYEGKKEYVVKSFRWGKQRGEWKNIPEELRLSEDSYVMILANDSKLAGFRYANGSTGNVLRFFGPHQIREEPREEDKDLFASDGDIEGMILDFDTPPPAPNLTTKEVEDAPEMEGAPGTFLIRLKGRRQKTTFLGDDVDVPVDVEIGKICRRVLTKDHPEKEPRPSYDSLKDWKEKHERVELTKDDDYHGPPQMGCKTCGCGGWITGKQARMRYETQYLRGLTQEGKGEKAGRVYFDYEEGKWVIGEIYYYPLRLAYASTVHKSQGLTLDSVQIDFVNKFFGSPSMAYVALSRVRTAEGMWLVGSPKLLASRCNVARKVLRWV